MVEKIMSQNQFDPVFANEKTGEDLPLDDLSLDPLPLHQGGCHCGAVRFEFRSAVDLTVYHCNCSICSMQGFIHLIVPATKFKLISDKNKLSTYLFNTEVARHFFCQQCGVKSFYIPRSNPGGFSVNYRCVDQSTLGEVSFDNFDGDQWEANASKLSHLSE